MAFVKGSPAKHEKPTAHEDLVVQANASVLPVVELAADSSPPAAQQAPTHSTNKTTREGEGEAVARNSPAPLNDDYLVAVTTRFRARTAEALRRAHLEQKLKRCEPTTQQEIIELAVQEWLRRHAFF
jgi:hypothetical protein